MYSKHYEIMPLICQDLYGNQRWLIGCAAWSWRQPKHFFRRVTNKFSLPLLQDLFENGLATEESGPSPICGVVEATTTKLQNCGKILVYIGNMLSTCF